jgi:hypothetical protein
MALTRLRAMMPTHFRVDNTLDELKAADFNTYLDSVSRFW